jgi:hypothetical protein
MSSRRVYGQNIQTRICESRNLEELQSIMSQVVKAHGQGLIADGTMRKLERRANKVAANLRASQIVLPPHGLLVPRRKSVGGIIMPS